MKSNLTLASASVSTVVLALSLAPAARADDESTHRLGDHPAVVVQRLYKSAGYDYASKFYPHPAGMRLYAEPPRDASDGTATAASGEAKPAGPDRIVSRASPRSAKLSARSGG